MSFERVLLIELVYPHTHYRDYAPLPAGLGYVSEALNRAAILNCVVDLNLDGSIGSLKRKVAQFEPDLIGMSMMSFQYRYNYRIIDELKRSFPKVAVVVGGPHVSTLRERVLNDCHSIDYGVTLEGEHTMVELCCGDSVPSQMKGLLYRDAIGQVRYSGDREFIVDLDANGYPSYSQFEMEKYPRPLSINILTSRGCPFHCIYCPVQLTIGRQFRIRGPRSVGNEFEYWYGKGVRTFSILDDNFCLIRERVFGICDDLEARRLSGIRITLANGVRADTVDREMLERMKEVGFCHIAFGVEAGNDRILSRLRKGVEIKRIQRAIEDACNLGYRVELFFLLGSPGETFEDVRDSMNLALRYPVYDVRFYNLIPFPKTELFEWVVSNGYFVQSPDHYLNDASHWLHKPVFATPELKLNERKYLFKWANRIVRLRTLKVKQKFLGQEKAKKLEDWAVPPSLSRYLVKAYFSPSFQQVFVWTGILTRVKRILRSIRRLNTRFFRDGRS